jgi:hypothetical protein
MHDYFPRPFPKEDNANYITPFSFASSFKHRHWARIVAGRVALTSLAIAIAKRSRFGISDRKPLFAHMSDISEALMQH